MKHPFTKMQGCGNDFVVFDDMQQSLPTDPKTIQHIANRKTGIGCDQILLVSPPRKQPLTLTIVFLMRTAAKWVNVAMVRAA